MDRLAKCHLGPCAGVVAIDRFVLVPLGLGKFGPQGLQLVPKGWRSHRLGQDAQAGAAIGLVQAQPLRQVG